MANQPLLRNWPRKLRTEFGEITQNNGHYDVQGHSRSTELCCDSALFIPVALSVSLSISLSIYSVRDSLSTAYLSLSISLSVSLCARSHQHECLRGRNKNLFSEVVFSSPFRPFSSFHLPSFCSFSRLDAALSPATGEAIFAAKRHVPWALNTQTRFCCNCKAALFPISDSSTRYDTRTANRLIRTALLT